MGKKVKCPSKEIETFEYMAPTFRVVFSSTLPLSIQFHRTRTPGKKPGRSWFYLGKSGWFSFFSFTRSFFFPMTLCFNQKTQEWQMSLDLFREIEQQGLAASSVGHNYALSACRQGKRWKHGFEIMEVMKAGQLSFFL